jgi:hypothetical protein
MDKGATNKSIILLNAFFALFEQFIGVYDKIANELHNLNFALLFIKLLILVISTLVSMLVRDFYAYIKRKYAKKNS